MEAIGGALLFFFTIVGFITSIRWCWRKFRSPKKTNRPVQNEFDLGELKVGNLNLTWAIEYEDNTGKITNRLITVREIYGPHDAIYIKYLKAYCHKRKDDRTFNVFNILTAHDAETGEVVPLRNSYRLWKWLEGREGGLPDGPPKPPRKRIPKAPPAAPLADPSEPTASRG